MTVAALGLIPDETIFSPLSLTLTLHALLPHSFFFKNDLGNSVSVSEQSLDQAKSQMGFRQTLRREGQLPHPRHVGLCQA